MGELRTLALQMEQMAAEEYWVEHLFEKTTRIKKILMNILYRGSLPGHCSATLTKHKTLAGGLPLNDSVGHLATISTGLANQTSGGCKSANTIVVDFGSDYIEVEEDEFLYLGFYLSNAVVCSVVALIYYEE